MKDFFKKNYIIVSAFLLPIIFIGGVTLTIYLPSLFLSTDYDFVYVICSEDYSRSSCRDYLGKRYSVKENKLVINNLDSNVDLSENKKPFLEEDYNPRFFFHDNKKNESREVELAFIENLRLSGLLTSPDNVSVSSGYSGGSDFIDIFGGGSSYGYYLEKGDNRAKLNLINNGNRNYYYRENFGFIGWVLN